MILVWMLVLVRSDTTLGRGQEITVVQSCTKKVDVVGVWDISVRVPWVPHVGVTEVTYGGV